MARDIGLASRHYRADVELILQGFSAAMEGRPDGQQTDCVRGWYIFLTLRMVGQRCEGEERWSASSWWRIQCFCPASHEHEFGDGALLHPQKRD